MNSPGISVDPFYCHPGLQGAHEKGAVERQIGWFRRNHLVPVPEVDSFEQLNAMVDAWTRPTTADASAPGAHTVSEMFAIEQPQLTPLPDEPFETGTWLGPRVDRYSQVAVRTNRYSVPVRLVGRQVRVHRHASHLVVYDGRAEVARHERLMAKGRTRLDRDHYLEALLRKPGALPGSTALEQARAAGRFTPVHDAYRGFLAKLLMAECDDRARRRSEQRINAAAFPRDKSLRVFDFDANPHVDPAVVHTLVRCDWVKKGLPLRLIGDSGTGKSHLLIALGTEAAMAGFRLRYVLATKLVNELVEAADEKVLAKTIARYGRVDLYALTSSQWQGGFGENVTVSNLGDPLEIFLTAAPGFE